MLIFENLLSTINYFTVKDLFSKFSISKMRVKMNFRIKTKNYATDPEIWPSRKATL